jgi:thiamine kinase-like enzyme
LIKIIKNTHYNIEIASKIKEIILKEETLLKNCDQGKSIQFGNATATVIQSDRNIVIEIRFSHNLKAFIAKFPSDGNDAIIKWETNQWEYLAKGLKNKHAFLPSFIAFDDEIRCLILNKLEGLSAYKSMRLTVFNHISIKNRLKILDNFYELGKLLSDMHNMPFCSIASPLTSPVWQRLDSLSNTNILNKTLSKGLLLYKRFYKTDNKTSWVHGNLRGDNIFFTPEGVILIDLERAGAGNPMEDLGRLIAFILMFRKFPLFPKYLWKSIIDHIITGYSSTSEIDSRTLLNAVLGEILYVYGRDYVLKKIAFKRRIWRIGLENIILHIIKILEDSSFEIMNSPSAIVK